MESMFKFIDANQDTLQTDFMTWVGDNSAHNVWDNTNEEVTNYTLSITDTWRSTQSKPIQVFPI